MEVKCGCRTVFIQLFLLPFPFVDCNRMLRRSETRHCETRRPKSVPRRHQLYRSIADRAERGHTGQRTKSGNSTRSLFVRLDFTTLHDFPAQFLDGLGFGRVGQKSPIIRRVIELGAGIYARAELEALRFL